MTAADQARSEFEIVGKTYRLLLVNDARLIGSRIPFNPMRLEDEAHLERVIAARARLIAVMRSRAACAGPSVPCPTRAGIPWASNTGENHAH